MELSGCANHFDHRLDNHYHARCLKCGRVFDVDMDYIPNFSERIRDTHGFSFSGYDLIFKGNLHGVQKIGTTKQIII